MRLSARGEEEFSILRTYTDEGANKYRVPRIMERQMERMRAHACA